MPSTDPGWRYHAMNLRTRQWIHRDLPLRDVSLKPVISGPYELSATIAPDWPDLIGEDGEPVLKEWSTLIVAEHQDVIRGGGIVTAAPNTGPALELSCTGFSAYPGGQPLVSDLVWGGAPAGQTGTGVDPADVYRALWAHLQSLPGGNLGVTVDSLATPFRLGSWYNARKLATPDDPNPKASDIEPEIPINQVPPPGYRKPPAATGKTVHWQYGLYAYDNIDVGSKLDELAKMAPLDWREEYVWADAAKTDVALRLRLGYSRLGRRRDDLRFVEGENVTEVIPLDRDAGDYANVIVGRGAGEGSKQITTTVSGLEPDRLRRARALDRGDTTTEAALRTEAMEELGRSLLLGDISSVVVDGTHPHAPIGSFDPGDDIYVQLHVGWRQLGLWVRVLALDYTPYAEQPRVTLTCARSDSFDYAGGS